MYPSGTQRNVTECIHSIMYSYAFIYIPIHVYKGVDHCTSSHFLFVFMGCHPETLQAALEQYLLAVLALEPEA